MYLGKHGRLFENFNLELSLVLNELKMRRVLVFAASAQTIAGLRIG